jgi:transposase
VNACTIQNPLATLGQNISLIGGMSIDGLIATMSVVGSVNTDVFLFYVQEILIPQLWVGAIVLMDNLPVHHAHQVREALVAVGAKLVFLPPYSPDLSPIELCWSFSSNFCVRLLLELVKHWIKL